MPAESTALEYKEAWAALPQSFFETVCAFLNRDGGDIVLGVADNGAVTGVSSAAAGQMLRDISNLSNNPQKIFPPYLLFPKLEIVDGKTLIRTHVPCSSQVHRIGGEVFLRSEDGDYRLKDPYQIAGLVNRKLSFYSEQRVIPWLGMADLSPSLFTRARELFRIHHKDHPWLRLNDEDILRTGGFIRKDPLTAENGYTLAAALMFGTDATIQQAAPGMSFDALLRRRNIARYDDRLLLHTNLIDTFDRMMGFVEKHLDDPFYMEGTSRVNLRDRIFRELVSNLIAHREYTSAAPASLTIFNNKVVFKNPHVPHVVGKLDTEHFTPFPKNPIICNFMLQMGRYEQAGSGVYNVTRYLPFYTPNAKPLFEEFHDIFQITVPIPMLEDRENEAHDEAHDGENRESEAHDEAHDGETRENEAHDEAHDGKNRESEAHDDENVLSDMEVSILDLCADNPQSTPELLRLLGYKQRTGNFKRAISRLIGQQSLLELTLPNALRSKNQKYRLTAKGKAAIAALKNGGKK